MASDLNTSPATHRKIPNFSIHEESSPPTDSLDSKYHRYAAATPGKAVESKSSNSGVELPLTTSRMVNSRMNYSLAVGGDSSPYQRSTSSSGDDQSPIGTHHALVDHSKTSTTGTNKNPAPSFSVIAKSGAIGSADNHALTADVSEVDALRKQLEAANIRIAAMDYELTQQRITSQSIKDVLQSPSTGSVHPKTSTEKLISYQLPASFPMQSSNASSSNLSQSADHFQGPWNETKARGLPFLNFSANASVPSSGVGGRDPNTQSNWASFDQREIDPMSQIPTGPQPQRPGNLRVDTLGANQQFNLVPGDPAFDQMGRRGLGTAWRSGSAMGEAMLQGNNSYAGSVPPTPIGFTPPMTPMQMQQMNMMPNLPNPYSSRANGHGLSPTALEFNASGMQNINSNLANNCGITNIGLDNASAYMAPGEPTNYRRLLDRNMNCNWKYIVDKIVCSNDQQASIFLQQKLKLSSTEQKYELVEAIIAQAYPLMINRFGNFLIQRCFEHGTPDQVIAIANAIRGNTLNLSMDAFGCHVVQKAFDVVPEEYKAMMVHELLHRIPETVIHRYACHVWQKLFELRWSDSPPQIMKYVNEALRGMWHEVALGETGSLVVQNIFENCLDEDKRPCINEVLASIDLIAHGQFGNWCIQHICEHGLPADKSRAIEHVLRYATEYSIDQFASKVVEKCLKIGGPEFTERYLERVCEGRADRPRMPLIDIAGDQYGNYLVQYILINGSLQHRDVVAAHIRKHMVSLRGSKFGSRVAMLCGNSASATRPGAPAGMQLNNRFMHGMGGGRAPMGGPYR